MRAKLFLKEEDYAAFERILDEAFLGVPVRILGYWVMPNHWHMVVWPRDGLDHEVSDFFALADSDPRAAMARPLPLVGVGASVPGAVQVLPGGVGRAYGNELWCERIAQTLGLESTVRPRGRPRGTAL